MPFDIKPKEHFPYFGIHNCNWRVDAYVDSYNEIGSVHYVECWVDSDLMRVKETFPHATRVVFYSLNGKTPHEVEEDLKKLHNDDTCSRIFLSALDTPIPIELIQYFFDTASRLWNVNIEEISADPSNY